MISDQMHQSPEVGIAKSEEDIAEELLTEGILDHVPLPILDLKHYQERKPIDVQGTPVSEILISERR